jgi:general secretion pathway protein A
MYQSYYGLIEKPFNVTPDPRFLYLGSHHREALAHLQYAIQERKGFVAIIGEVGTGKTTLVHALLSHLPRKTRTAFIFSTSLTAKGLIKMMVNEFGIRTKGRTKTDLLLDLNQFLLRQYADGTDVLLIIDEAQNLSNKLLEEIRMLSNLETDRDKLLQIILVGQPELASRLATPELRQLRQRIGSRYQIHPLSPCETENYVRFRLQVAGFSHGSLFDSRALEVIHRYAQGVPRVINLICDGAMLLGYTRDQKEIGVDVINETVEDLQTLGVLDVPTACGISSSQVSEQVSGQVSGAEKRHSGWWIRQLFRSVSAIICLLFAAALFSLPLVYGGQEQNRSCEVIEYAVPSWSTWEQSFLPDSWTTFRTNSISQTMRRPQAADGIPTFLSQEDVLFSIHVASFRAVDRAKKLIETLQDKGFHDVHLVPARLAESGLWYRVMLGEYQNRDQALRIANEYVHSGTFHYAQPRRLSVADQADMGRPSEEETLPNS